MVAAEARGFLLGPALALALDAGFVLARKPGKLPYETVSAEYLLEYGADQLEVHATRSRDGARVLVHDDLLATGGTALALCELVEQLGGRSSAAASSSSSRSSTAAQRLAPRETHALLSYEWLETVPSARRSRTIAARAEQLWELIGDPHHLPRWWPRVERVEDVEGGRVHRGHAHVEGQARARRLPRASHARPTSARSSGSSSSRARRSRGC